MNARSRSGSWLLTRAPVWRALAKGTERLRRGRLSIAEADQALDGYQTLARDLATARQQLPGSNATAALESIFASYHGAISRAPQRIGASVLRLFQSEVPAIMSSLRLPLLWVTLLLALSAGAGWWLVMTYPELVSLIASRKMIEEVERGTLWTDGLLNIAPSSILSIRILSNNVVVAISAFCAGIFYGLGTIYMIAVNGLLLGATFAFTRQHGLDGELLRFVLAHGPVELSVVCIAGAAGVTIGESLVRPMRPTRRESFQYSTARAAKLLLPCALLLVGCGLIEGYISPDPTMPFAARAVIGLCYFGLMVALLTGHLLRAKRA
jgi:uncharacterized membrane protein SpoIIM required for sporulation